MLKKKKEADEPPPPPAPAEPKIKNPNNETYSLRVDVPVVSLDVSVILDKTHQFVPGLKAPQFLVLEDGVEQKVDTVRITQTPITAVMLLEFAANDWRAIYDMRNDAYSFFNSLASQRLHRGHDLRSQEQQFMLFVVCVPAFIIRQGWRRCRLE